MALLIASGNSYIPELSVFCITVYVFCSHSFSGEADSPAEIAADTFMATAKAPSAPDDSGVSQNALTAAKSEQDWRVASLRAVHYIHFYVQHVECETNITFRAEFVKKHPIPEQRTSPSSSQCKESSRRATLMNPAVRSSLGRRMFYTQA